MHQLTYKHAFDRVVATISLLALSPLFAIVGYLIHREDNGPVFFRQQRLGRHAVPFEVLKFRTMVVDADQYLDDAGRPTRDRVTSVGGPLRRWSLDELPQLVNIYRGEMSLVGPRPIPVDYLAKLTVEQRRRFEVRPGLTGLAQVTGRHSLPWSQRLLLDVSYVDDLSLKSDLKIILRTFGAIFSSETLLDRKASNLDI